MNTVLITGANRGLGFEFASQYAARGWAVLACCRNPEGADKLQALAQQNAEVKVIALDVTDEADIATLTVKLEGQSIDHLILNAGVLGDECAKLGEMSQAALLEVFKINSVAPALLIQALRDNVIASEHKTIAAISTRVASIDDNGSGGMYAYRASKTALNQIVVSAGNDLREHGVKTVLLHPGWVQTDMGGENATFTPQESVKGMISIVDALDSETSGTFRAFDNSPITW